MINWRWLLGLGAVGFLIGCSSPVNESSTSQTPSRAAVGQSSEPPSASLADESEGDAAENQLQQPPAIAVLTDTTVMPGDRIGPVTNTTSRADLANRFGELTLQDTEIPVGEGFTELGTTVKPTAEQSFSVIWLDDTAAQPASVKDFGPAWQTPEGIGVGTTFAELQDILGPFELYGFGWDYGGTVVLENTNLDNYYGALILRLQPADPATFQQQGEAFQAVQGDQRLASENPNLAALNLVVDEMIVYLNPPGR